MTLPASPTPDDDPGAPGAPAVLRRLLIAILILSLLNTALLGIVMFKAFQQ